MNPKTTAPGPGTFVGLLMAGLVGVALAILGCSKQGGGPASPEPTYSLSGNLRLVGHLRDELGNPTGDRAILDASGVRVHLVRDGVIADSALSNDGRFTFRVTLGTYSAFARIAGLTDSTEQLHVHDADRVFANAIELGSGGAVTASPNPFSATVDLAYTLATAGTVGLRVLSATGTPIRTLFSGAQPAGRHTVRWDGNDDASQPVRSGAYWIATEQGTLHTADLVFRDGVSVTGRLQLVANLFDELGAFTGRRVIDDATGARVRLARAGAMLDSTESVAGRYTFAAPTEGSYRASTWVVPSTPRSTQDFVVGLAPVSIPDTLKLEPVGDLRTYPNPFPSAHGLAIEFDLARAAPFEVVVLTLDGTRVWTAASPGVAGLNHIHWIAWDEHDQTLPNGLYWVIVLADDHQSYNLALKE